MVPVAYVFLDSFPLTPSGKLNRRALPAVESARGRPSEPVEGLVEHYAIAEIWSSVLGIGSIGRHDNFFALGGDSLQSLSIVLEAERAGWQITVSQLFELPTIAELAKVALPTANQNAKQRELAGPTIEQRDRIQLCPLALGQRNVWHQNQILSGTSFFQYSQCANDYRNVGCRGSREKLGRTHTSPRDFAHDLCDQRDGAGSSHRAGGIVRANPARSQPSGAKRPYGRSQTNRCCRILQVFRPVFRVAVASRASPVGRRRACIDTHAPPHRIRRSVKRHSGSRTRFPLSSLC